MSGQGRSALLITARTRVESEVIGALKREGYTAHTARNFDALDALADARPALVITDLALGPERSDWSVLRRQFPYSVFWAIEPPTARDHRQLVAAFRGGCEDCLEHPVTGAAVAARLKELEGASPTDGGPDLDEYMELAIDLTVPSDLALIEHVVRYLAGRCRDYRHYDPRTLVNLRIVLCETLSNAIRYGNGDDRSKSVSISARLSADQVTVRIADEGPGFDTSRIPDPTEPEALQSSRGRGLFLLQKLADRVSFNERGNEVTFTIRSGRDNG